jgi:RHS repeat-associated protein
VNGVDYTWDANGNLLNDGANTYTYDSANRLTSVNGTGSYAYNGLGDRLQQTMNGAVTNYTLDLNAGLTQVLTDGTNTYTYGLGRISQEQSGNDPEYFLTDALGSVRQVTSPSGQVTYAKSYDPYGVVTQASGTGQSVYGFTGESQDSYIKLIYLRSRMYSPVTGRFTSKDSWLGDYNRPISLNRWNYVEGNPINYSDPSGRMRWRLGEPIYHMPIEDYYEQYFFNPTKQLEYSIPGTPFRHPDMFNSFYGDVYEIEPYFYAANGAVQVQGYVTDLINARDAGLLHRDPNPFYTFDWANTSFHVGTGIDWPGPYRKTPLSVAFPFVDLLADYIGSGVVVYWLEPNILDPVLLAAYLATQRLAPNDRLLRKPNWQPQPALLYQPDPAFVLQLSCGTGLFMIGGTLMILTILDNASGVGIVDDVVTLPTGYYLINTGLKVATFVVAP